MLSLKINKNALNSHNSLNKWLKEDTFDEQ